MVGFVLDKLGASNKDAIDNATTKFHEHKGALEVHRTTADGAFRFVQLFMIDACNDIHREPILNFHLSGAEVMALVRKYSKEARMSTPIVGAWNA
ncbi:hypothetical protein PSAC2689_100093 [Paraburkholderia sacchari]|uniref:hypothetical protein n=1 Tax=Paraburkholderia sacchari TaxID=159450 RepID=UPI0039A4FC0C